ncbi:peroxiredoxin-like family protein [Paenibacillus sp. TAB 01]|uniref:peroxiredoxin-like family protein n=1 Tax=Paenibacillus sp. TAB 01 TaxID=3368988 RepID=UPI003752E519
MTILNLTDQLAAAAQAFQANTPMEAQVKFGQMIEQLQQTGKASGMKVGDKAPDFKLPNARSNEVILYDELGKGPVILVFYRGGWCPFCNMQLKAYQKVLPDIQALGAQLIAISPQKPDHSLSQQEKEELEFQVLTDLDGSVSSEYNLLFDVPQGAREVMEGFGLDLAEYNHASKWILPVPAVFMIDESSIIRSSYVNPNFMQRQSPEEIIRELQKL